MGRSGKKQSEVEDRCEKNGVQAGANILISVLAAYAIEQIAEGCYSVLSAGSKLAAIDWVIVVITGIALILTVARYYQGNGTYLLTEYAVWNYRELLPGTLVATPIRHLIDVTFHVLEYVTLVFAGHAIANDKALCGASKWLVVLFVIDSLWNAYGLINDKDRDTPSAASRKTRTNWLVINISGAVILFCFVYFSTTYCYIAIISVLVLSLYVDIKMNFRFYYAGPPRPVFIRSSQAAMGVSCITALAQVRNAPLSTSDERENLKESLDKLLAFFMDDRERAKLLFARSPSRLHVGLYVENNGILKPFFRMAHDGISMQNRHFPIGEHYIGQAYSKLDTPVKALFFTKTGAQLSKTNGDKHYKSSIIVNIFWPPSGERREKLGTLTLTSDKEEYFTESFHEAVVVGIAMEVSYVIEKVFGHLTLKDLKKKLADFSLPRAS